MQEIVLCATAPTAATPGPGGISLYNIQTGAILASFKQSNAAQHSIAVVESRNGQGGFILAAQSDKSILNVYNFQKDQISLKIVLPERLTCLATDPAGRYCAGGTPQGRIYLWEIASGILYNAWDAHYRQTTVLRFTLDGAALLSGSQDSRVSVWSVSRPFLSGRLVDDSLQNDIPVPYCTLSDHTLPITDIVCGIGPFPTCRVLTSSIDHSVKLWDLSSRSLLTIFHFPRPISLLAWDLTERLFFAASPDGAIHQMNLFRQRESGGQIVEAVGGSGIRDIVRVEEESGIAKKRLISVGEPITAMTISFTSSFLVVGTEAGLMMVYDIPSHQLLRTISTHGGLSITFIATMLKPPDLIGHFSLSLAVGSSADIKNIIPVMPVIPFQKMKDPKTREAHEVSMLLPPNNDNTCQDILEYSEEEFLRDYNFFVQPLGATATAPKTDTVSLKAKVDNLETEVGYLREQLAKAKSINDSMWDTVVQRVVEQATEKDEEVEPEGGKKRRRICD